MAALAGLLTIRIPLWAKFAASALLMLLVLAKVDASSFARVVFDSNPYFILLALGLCMAAWAINTYKWQVLLAGSGFQAKYLDLARLNFIGMFYNLVLPGQVGGEVVKSVQLARLSVSGPAAAMSVVSDRVTGLLAILLLGLAGAVLLPPEAARQLDLLPWLIGLAVAMSAATVVLVAGRGPAAVIATSKALRLPDGHHLSRLGAWAGRSPVPMRSLSSLWLPMFLSLTFQAAIVGVNFLVCLALGIPLTYAHLMLIVGVVSLLQSLPISVAGIGVREGAYVYLLQLQGIAAPSALALSLLIFGIQVVMALLGGLLQLRALLKGGQANND